VHYTGTFPLGHSDSLKLSYLISNNDNVFTLRNSLGTYTVLAKTYQFFVTDVAAVISSPSDVLLFLSIVVRSD